MFVADADRTFVRAVAAGGSVVTELGNDAFGQHGGRIKDPFGNIWWVTSHVEDVAEDQMWQRLRQPVYAKAMRIAQETLDAELSSRSHGRCSMPVETN